MVWATNFDRGYTGCGAAKRTSRRSASGKKSGTRWHRSPTSGFEWSSTGERVSCVNDTTRTGVTQQAAHDGCRATSTLTADTITSRQGQGRIGPG